MTPTPAGTAPDTPAPGTSRLGVAPLSALDLSVTDYVRAAAGAGFAEVGLRAARILDSDPEFPLDVDSEAFAAIERAIADTGVTVLDVEVFSIGPGTTPADWEPILEVGRRLGASYLNVVGNDPDFGAFTGQVVRLSRDARAVGITPVLEPIAYRPFDSFRRALELAERAGCAVELDVLHFQRTGATLELVASAPEAFPILQLCDAPARLGTRLGELRELAGAEDPLLLQAAESRSLRQLVGEGDAPLAELLRILPDDVHLSVEVPNVNVRGELNGAAYLALLAERTRQALAVLMGS